MCRIEREGPLDSLRREADIERRLKLRTLHELCSRQFSGPLSGHYLMTAAWPS